MKISKTITLAFILVLIVAVVTVLIITKKHGYGRNIFQFVTIEKGDIKSSISSTGMMHPRSVVEVGTQVSGTFAKIYSDYNDVVKKGQLLAELDNKLLQSATDEANAVVLSTQANLIFSRPDYFQNKKLYEKGLLSEMEFLKSKSKYFVDSSAFLSANATLTRARINQGYAKIESPIQGTVIEKNVEAGQTVAANFNTPIVFVIAEDLSEMEIRATVDESDISNIFIGQKVEFSVLACPDSIFSGEVRQIRLQPKIIQNVVNYIVVINTDNKNNMLRPGMTATVDFIIQQKKEVLLVSKSVLSFNPPQKMATAFFRKMQKKIEALPDSLKWQMQPPPPPGSGSPFIPDSTGQQMQHPMMSGSPESMDPYKRQMQPSPTGSGLPFYPDSFKQSMQPPPSGNLESKDQQTQPPPPPLGEAGLSDHFGQIWYLDDQSELAMEPVETGVSDDNNIEIVRCRNLKQGMRVICGIIESMKKNKSSTQITNQLMPSGNQQGGGGPPPPPGGP